MESSEEVSEVHPAIGERVGSAKASRFVTMGALGGKVDVPTFELGLKETLFEIKLFDSCELSGTVSIKSFD